MSTGVEALASYLHLVNLLFLCGLSVHHQPQVDEVAQALTLNGG